MLSKKYKLAIVTSRTKRGAGIALSFLRAKEYFKVVVKFEDFKHPKPDPESLLIAMKKLKVQPHETVFIGDSPTDAQAAEAAGVNFLGFTAFSKKSLSTTRLRTDSMLKIPKIIQNISYELIQ